jgi:hypothetical protein
VALDLNDVVSLKTAVSLGPPAGHTEIMIVRTCDVPTHSTTIIFLL